MNSNKKIEKNKMQRQWLANIRSGTECMRICHQIISCNKNKIIKEKKTISRSVYHDNRFQCERSLDQSTMPCTLLLLLTLLPFLLNALLVDFPPF